MGLKLQSQQSENFAETCDMLPLLKAVDRIE